MYKKDSSSHHCPVTQQISPSNEQLKQAGETAQWLTLLQHKHEDQSLDPTIAKKCWVGVLSHNLASESSLVEPGLSG